MLALPPTIAGISSKYSSGLAPGIQFALELTDQSSLSEMSARDDLPFSRPLNSANLGGPAATTTTETQPPFFPFQRCVCVLVFLSVLSPTFSRPSSVACR